MSLGNNCLGNQFPSMASESTDGAVPGTQARTFYVPETYHGEQSVGYMMRRIIVAISQRVDCELSGPTNPTYPQWMPLHKLYTGAANTVAELARECHLDAGAMTRLLDRLEAKGLVRRARCTSDRRVVKIELTPEGKTAAQSVPHVLCEVQNDFLAGFTEQEWRQLQGFLRRMLDNSEGAAGQAGGSTKDGANT